MHGLPGIEKVRIKDKNEGYVVHDFMARRIGYLLVVVALFLCIGAFVTQQELSEGRLKLGEMEALLEGERGKTAPLKEALVAKERTLQWRKSIIDEKQAKLDKIDSTATDELDALVGKDRTIQWKQQVIDEKAKTIKRLQKRKKDVEGKLFELHKLHALGSKVAHAKLVQMMSMVQKYLSRQKKAGEIIRVTRRNSVNTLEEYKEKIQKMAQELQWKPQVKKQLLDETEEMSDTVVRLMKFMSDEIVKENAAAEDRLAEISRSLVNEIHADIDDEQEDFFYTLDVDGYEDSAAVKAMKTKLSGWQNTFVKLIQDFNSKVKAIPDNAGEAANDVPGAKQLLSNLRRGEIAYGEGLKKMLDMLKKHKALKKGMQKEDIPQVFEEWLNRIQFAPNKSMMMEKLKEWEGGKLTDYQMLVYIEEKIQQQQVPGDWLSDPTADAGGVFKGYDEEVDAGSIEFDAASNGWKLEDALTHAIKQAAKGAAPVVN